MMIVTTVLPNKWGNSCLFVVHRVGFAEIRGHHAFVVAGFTAGMMVVLLLMVVSWRWTPIAIVFPVMFVLF